MTVRNFIVSTEPGVQAGLPDSFSRTRRTLIFVAVLASCASPPPSTPPAAPTPAPLPVPPVAPPPVNRWSIASAAAAANFLVEARATFSTRADSLARSDTSVSRTTLRVVPRGAAIDVTISAYTINSSYSQPLALGVATRAVGRFDASGGIVFEGPGQGSCTALSSAAFESTRDFWVRWPADVSVGTQWRDSATAGACRDGIPLRVTIVRHYRVTAVSRDSLQQLIEVARNSTVSVTGHGVLRGDSIALSGEGTGSATLRVAAATGWLFDGNGSSALQLRAIGKTRTQVVDQRVEFTLRQTDTPR